MPNRLTVFFPLHEAARVQLFHMNLVLVSLGENEADDESIPVRFEGASFEHNYWTMTVVGKDGERRTYVLVYYPRQKVWRSKHTPKDGKRYELRMVPSGTLPPSPPAPPKEAEKPISVVADAAYIGETITLLIHESRAAKQRFSLEGSKRHDAIAIGRYLVALAQVAELVTKAPHMTTKSELRALVVDGLTPHAAHVEDEGLREEIERQPNIPE
jgi:hypothetical protein